MTLKMGISNLELRIYLLVNLKGDTMTVIEAITQAENILGTIPVSGRESVKKINAIFDLLDASVAALNPPPEEQPKEEGNN